jgi:hypothetical protein
MTETKTNPILRLLPSLTDVAFLLPLIFMFGGLNGARTMLGDGDTGWHIRAGEWILANGAVPKQDLFSYTMPDRPWFAWEWLWDVAFAWLHQRWGMAAVVMASLLVLSLTSALMYRLAYRRCGNPLVAIGVTGLAVAGASIHWLARPHLFTMLFLVIFLAILDRVREGRTQLLWILPALTVPWTNLHGGFFVGIFVLGIYGVSEIFTALMAVEGEARRPNLRMAGLYWAAGAGCALASLANPYGYQLHKHIYLYLRDPFIMKYIGEFQGTNFRMGQGMFLEVMLMLGAGAAIWYGKRKQYGSVIMIAAWAHLSLMVVRNLPLYMIVAAPLVALPVADWLRALASARIAGWVRTVATTVDEIAAEISPLEQPWRLHAVSAAVMAVLALAMTSPAAGKNLLVTYDPERYPEKALALLNEPGQRVFADDEWGDYLIYKLSGQGTKVFVDGRSDFYGEKFNQAYVDVMNVKYTWPQTLDRYGVNTLLLHADAPLAGAVKESARWKVVYDDGLAIVFRAAGTAPGNLTVKTMRDGRPEEVKNP